MKMFRCNNCGKVDEERFLVPKCLDCGSFSVVDVTQAETLNYILTEYMASAGHIMRRPTVEEGHTKACLAKTAQSVIENWRDDEGVGDRDFAFLIDTFKDTVYDYLNGSELSDCICPQRYEEDGHYLRIRSRRSDTGEWFTETHFMSLTDAVEMISFDIGTGFYDMAWIGLDDFSQPGVVPCLWASLSYNEIA